MSHYTIPSSDPRLGRHVNHDARSRAFGFAAPELPIKPKKWARHGPVLDQGRLGSCTGNAAVGCLNHAPFYVAPKGRIFYEEDAISVYSRATQIDPYDGTYPPDDTGSDGSSVAKVLQERQLIVSYVHVFHGVDELRQVMMHSPAIIGIGFRKSMYDPDPISGVVEVSGPVVGGHEMCVDGWEKTRGFRVLNSWGASWGLRGCCYISESDMQILLDDDGDATVFNR